MHLRLLAAVWLAALFATTAHAQTSNVVDTGQVKAELIAHAPDGVTPGKPLWLGLSITHKPHWHTYWKNPGDSGLPTTLEWQLPAGIKAGDIDWPTPRRLPVGPLMNYGFEGQLLLPVQFTVSDDFKGPSLDINLRADWLVCKDVCIPESGEFSLRLPAQAATALHAARFEAAAAARPLVAPGVTTTLTLSPTGLTLKVDGLPASLHRKVLNAFPELAGVIDNAARGSQHWNGNVWSADIPLSAQRSESPTEMVFVLAARDGGSGVQVSAPLQGAWPAPGAGQTSAPPQALDADEGVALGLGLSLLLALIGGALLNLMPCVFPVLSLKVLGFARHAHDRRALLAGGLAYTAGAVLSFVALAALLLALRAGGEQIGWGFQLQSPAFVAALALLFTLIGLNLAGLFEFGSVLPSGLASLQARHPLVDSALTGVLAVAIASPCTAPFMGAALGAAAVLPTAQALSIFAALGFGMALPYLIASAWPAAARALPRPGPWMQRFRSVMAFPMFATVVWLLWVLGQQTGIDGVASLLALMVALAFLAWSLGSPGMGTKTRAAFTLTAAAVLVATLWWALPALRELPPGAATSKSSEVEGDWGEWSTQRVAELNAQGSTVFVDFTAAWCVTCQLNKRTTLNHPEVLADFTARGVTRLRADWTLRDPAISAELTRLGRNGVPVYALYRPGVAQPQLLGEILSVAEVRAALARP